MRRILLLLVIGVVSDSAIAASWRDMREEAGKGLPPRIQYYNRLKGEPKLVSLFPSLDEPESLNVRLVGKWGRGPAATVMAGLCRVASTSATSKQALSA
jgi:hypothetical protein